MNLLVNIQHQWGFAAKAVTEKKKGLEKLPDLQSIFPVPKIEY